MDFKDLVCWLIVQIGPISLNVTTPADCIMEAIWVNRGKKSASQARRHSAHCKNLNTMRASSRRLDPGHLPGESGVHDDRTSHILRSGRKMTPACY